MNTNRLSESFTIKPAIKTDNGYVGIMSIIDFERIFGVNIQYLDMEQQKNQSPSLLTVAINLFSGDLCLNSEDESFVFSGEYVFIDGLKKFEIIKVHPNSSVQIGFTTYTQEEVRKYLSDINRI